MDTRHSEIVEGQGLTESRLNQDFINWLNVWGPKVLYLVLAIVVVYAGTQWWQRRQVAMLDQAFAALDSARISGSPIALESVARDHAGQGAVGQLASLDAADAYLAQARLGMLPSADPTTGQGVLTPEQVTEALDKADKLYEKVFVSTSMKKLPTVHVSSRWGQASVSLQRGDYEAAKRLYQEVDALAQAASLFSISEIAQEKLAELETLQTLGPLISSEDIASITPRQEILNQPSNSFLPDSAPVGAQTRDENEPDFVPPTTTIDISLPFSPKPPDQDPSGTDSSETDSTDDGSNL
jgi:hypothetical protein